MTNLKDEITQNRSEKGGVNIVWLQGEHQINTSKRGSIETHARCGCVCLQELLSCVMLVGFLFSAAE